MGRSVGYAHDAVSTVYINLELGDDEDEREWNWRDFRSNLQHALMEKYPSFDLADTWHDREGHIILENVLAYVVLYQYYDLVSVNLVPIEQSDGYSDTEALNNLADGWVNQISQGFTRLLDENFQTLVKQGHMSNGEGVYRLKGTQGW